MIYPYRCPCGNEFEVIKHSKIIDRVEVCPNCGHNCTKENRYISRTSFYGASDWDSAEYNPGLGCVTRNKLHRDRIAKDRGLIEIGNEDIVKHDIELEKERDRKIDEKWEKL